MELQQNLLLSHACGVGDPVPPELTRLMLQLKIHALGLGQSGISRSTFLQLLKFEQLGLTPWIPSRGSVGASGDLAPRHQYVGDPGVADRHGRQLGYAALATLNDMEPSGRQLCFDETVGFFGKGGFNPFDHVLDVHVDNLRALVKSSVY